ncbi:MAG: diguanylate cyclase [Clostridiales bacterium]|nr:diguanylate cyclase [Clostridiales bacterium]
MDTRYEHVDAPTGITIIDPPPGCELCWVCARVCVARAIRVADGSPRVVTERCVRCGACVGACGSGGMRVRDDVPRVRSLLASSAKVVVVLATEFAAAMHPATPERVEEACLALGFHAVESTFLGEEMVAVEYETVWASAEPELPRRPMLRSTCPVVTEWVRKYRPSLAGCLAPIVPPYIAQARLVREMYAGPDLAVVYVSPCFARKDEYADIAFAGAIDAVIGFDELKSMVSGIAGTEGVTGGSQARSLAARKEISLTDGFPRTLLQARDNVPGGVVTVRGLATVDRLLAAIEAGETTPGVVDMLYCESCVDGPAMGAHLSSYARRSLRTFELTQHRTAPIPSRRVLTLLPGVEVRREFSPDPVPLLSFDDAAIDAALRDGGFSSRDETRDCGACGYRTCVEHAAAVLAGASQWRMCVPMHVRGLEDQVAALRESATVDPLTGLWNRRVFAERLVNEFARFRRYGPSLSLLMLDLDGFKAINDTYGHSTGDATLRAVADTIKNVLRETDIAVRYGGDEFSIILPGVDKTAAYAVAEKLRIAVSRLRVPAGAEAAGIVPVTISVGLASAHSAMTSHEVLFEDADRALYRAKEQGRDRVRLAPGHEER